MTRNRDDAQDLVQDAAVRAFRAFDSFQPGTNFKAWFLRIVTNLYLNEYRRKQRQPAPMSIEEAPELFLYTQTKNQGLHGPARDPAAAVLGKLSEEEVAAAIASLPEEFRVVAS